MEAASSCTAPPREWQMVESLDTINTLLMLPFVGPLPPGLLLPRSAQSRCAAILLFLQLLCCVLAPAVAQAALVPGEPPAGRTGRPPPRPQTQGPLALAVHHCERKMAALERSLRRHLAPFATAGPRVLLFWWPACAALAIASCMLTAAD